MAYDKDLDPQNNRFFKYTSQEYQKQFEESKENPFDKYTTDEYAENFRVQTLDEYLEQPKRDAQVVQPLGVTIREDARKIWQNVIEEMLGEDEELNFTKFMERGLGKGNLNIATQFHTENKFRIQGAADYRQALQEVEDAGILETMIEQGATILGDVPTLGIGYGIGSAIGGPTVGAYGAGFLTEAVRTTYLRALEKENDENPVDTFSEWWDIFIDEGISEGNKAGMTLAVTQMSPGIVGPILSKLPLVSKETARGLVGEYISQMTAFTAMGYYFNGELPDRRTLLADAGLFGVLNISRFGKKAIKEESLKKGKAQDEILEEALNDPAKKDILYSENISTFTKDADGNIIGSPEKYIEVSMLDQLPTIDGKVAGTDPRLRLEISKLDEETPSTFIEFTDEAAIKGKTKKEKTELELTPEGQVEGVQVGSKKYREAIEKVGKSLQDEPYMKRKAQEIREKLKNMKAGFSVIWRDNKYVTRTIEQRYDYDTRKSEQGMSPYDRLRMLTAAGQKAESVLLHGVPKSINSVETVGPGIIPILENYKIVTPELRKLTDHYMLSKGLLERYKQGKETLTTEQLKIHRTIVKESPQFIKDATKEMQRFLDQELNYYVESGIISKKEYKAMREANKNYIPVHKVVTEPQSFSKDQPYSEVVTSPYKEYLGGGSKYASPINTIINNTMYRMVLAERNIAYKNFFDKTYEVNPKLIPEVLGKRRLKKDQVDIDIKDLSKALDVSEDLLRAGGVGEGFAIFRKSEPFALKANEVAIKRKGFIEIYTLDPNLAAAFKIDNPFIADFLGYGFEKNLIQRPVTKAIKVGVTADPEMQLKNLARDTVGNSVFSKNLDNIPFYTSARGAFLFFGNKPFTFKKPPSWTKPLDIFVKDGEGFLQAAIEGGLLRQTYFKFDNEYFSPEMRKYFQDRKFKNQIEGKDTDYALKQLWATAADFSESISKLGDLELTYKRLQKTDLSSPEAMRKAVLDAKDLMDFSKMGLKTQAINQISAFYSPKILGADKLYEAVRYRPMETAIKSYLYITLPATILYAISHDDPAYDDLTEFEKDLGYNIPYKFGSADTKFLHVPGAFELYQFAGVAPIKLLQAYKEQDPERFTDYTTRFILNWGSSLVLHRLADVYRITGETMANYSLFYKNNIVNQNNQRFLPPWQTTSYTSEIAKTIAKKINVSAGKVDYMIRQTTGGIGRNVLDLTDYLAKKTGFVASPIDPWSDEWIENFNTIPVIRSFIKGNPKMNSEPITRLYKIWNKSKPLIDTVNKLENEGRFEEADKLIAENQVMYDLHIDLKIAIDDIKKSREEVEFIQQSEEISANEKFQLLEAEYSLIVDLSRTALKDYIYYRNKLKTDLEAETKADEEKRKQELNRIYKESMIK